MNFVQVAWSLGILLSSWPVLIVSTGLMFAKRITLQSIQPLRCSGEFYLNLNEHQSCTARIMDNVFRVRKIARVSGRVEVENFLNIASSLILYEVFFRGTLHKMKKD